MNIDNVWQQYSSKLKGLLHSKISNSADVDDLLQEILIKTHREIGSLKSKDKLKPWLYKLANNVVNDFYRSQGRRVSFQSDIGQEELSLENDSPLALEQLSECVIPFINALPKREAELLRTIDIQGRSQKEYATELGLSYSALKSRVQRARQKLRALFESCCHLELDRKGNVIDFLENPDQCRNC
ncbi:RNA polymerase sigma factor SigZ [Neptuniibacter sp.]|uniref:RNA polymerase sigma factor SigZ n=1 Tax=Neptuniibacter sp. TaxID=1962643 RepID=UPI002634DA48|nr:RNA polymerase sigma factor SigZ [Neptuniibacter sp.]MCP4596918.1 RNA polymerase sigma factor SigZ [Neptuniibacter sp.]